MTQGAVAGLVLAAGAGRRMGAPKALLRDESGVPWLHRSTSALVAAGAEPVLVTLGAQAQDAARLLPPGVLAVPVHSWQEGVAASLRAGLEATTQHAPHVAAVLVTLVDLPRQQPAAAVRVRGPQPGPADLRQARYDGRPGHPVLIGREHWPGVLEALSGDVGARAYLHEHAAVPVDCTDLGGGDDVDVPVHRSGGWS